MKKRNFAIALPIISALLILLDQLAKMAADRWLKEAGLVKVIGDFVVLVYARNTGAFLSLGAGLAEPLRIAFLIVLPIAVLSAFVIIYMRKPRVDGRDLALLCLLMGGGLGNLVDRIFRGEVTDYLLFTLGGRIRTGVMNLADLYILGVVIILVIELFRIRKSPEPVPGEKGTSETGGPGGA